jgi:DTW domain-containing protein YfiP
VLFPGPAPGPAAPAPERIVVLDGSWSQARRMLQRIPALRALPRLALAPPAPAPGAPRLRRPTVDGGVSTIEAMALALARLGEPDAAAGLDRLYAAARQRVWRLRGVA